MLGGERASESASVRVAPAGERENKKTSCLIVPLSVLRQNFVVLSPAGYTFAVSRAQKSRAALRIGD